MTTTGRSRLRRGLLLAPLLATALVAPVAVSADSSTVRAAGPELVAVVSYAGAALPDVPGVRVQRELPAVRAAVVRGDAAELAALAATPGVRSVVPDSPLSFTSSPGRPSRSPAARPAGAPAPEPTARQPLLASEQLGGTAGRPGAGQGVRVAVVDTGVSDSPALSRGSGRLVDAFDSRRGSSGSPRGPLTDGYGHGTFMAGLVAGGPMRGTGGRAVGVAPGATVLVVRVAEADGTTSLSQVLAGLDWVAAHARHVDVVSLSLGADRPGSGYVRDPLTDAVQAVQDAGVTAVVSAGNSAGTLTDPGFLPTTITVGAADLRTRTVAGESGSGVVAGIRKPDVVASGVSVLGVLPSRSLVAAQNSAAEVSEGLYRGSGTSQAAAITSGVAALVLSRHPHATHDDVKATLQSSADQLRDRRGGSGLVRVPASLVRVQGSTSWSGGSRPGGSSSPEWAASSWDASSWDASSWDASSWDASSWDASSWDASSWDASSWDASSWDASSWDAGSWSSTW